ncbi:MAG: hypothetical protein ACOYK6_04915 [Chthoniobacterales bacterium]
MFNNKIPSSGSLYQSSRSSSDSSRSSSPREEGIELLGANSSEYGSITSAPHEEGDSLIQSDSSHSSSHGMSEIGGSNAGRSSNWWSSVRACCSRFFTWNGSSRDGNIQFENVTAVNHEKANSPQETRVTSSNTVALGALSVGRRRCVAVFVPTESRIDGGEDARAKVIELLDQSIQSNSESSPEAQLEKDIVTAPRFSSYTLKSSSGAPVELVGNADAVEVMKQFCGEAFNEVVSIANQKMGVYGQNAIEYAVVGSKSVVQGTTYAFPGDTGTTPTAKISIEKKDGSPPRFLVHFLNEGTTKIAYQKLKDGSGEFVSYYIQLDEDSLDSLDSLTKDQAAERDNTKEATKMARTSVVIEVVNNEDSNSYSKNCVELSNSYTITK